MHSLGGVGKKTKPIPTTFKANMQNDGFLSTTAGQNSRNGYRPIKDAQNCKITFLNCDDGKSEDDGKHLNEGSVHKSTSLCNVRLMQHQMMPKYVSSQSLEETSNSSLEEGMKSCDENRPSCKIYHLSPSKPSLNSNLNFGKALSEEKWRYLRRETSTEILIQPKPHHPLLNENNSFLKMRKRHGLIETNQTTFVS